MPAVTAARDGLELCRDDAFAAPSSTSHRMRVELRDLARRSADTQPLAGPGTGDGHGDADAHQWDPPEQ